MAAQQKGTRKYWDGSIKLSATQWRSIMAVFKNKKWTHLKDRLELLRAAKGVMLRRNFGNFNRYNGLLRAAGSPFRIQFIGTGRSVKDLVGIVREADGVERDTLKQDEIKFKLQRFEVALDPPVDIFALDMTCGNGFWPKSFGSEEQLRSFLEGVQACSSLYGKPLTLPEIPSKAIQSIA